MIIQSEVNCELVNVSGRKREREERRRVEDEK